MASELVVGTLSRFRRYGQAAASALDADGDKTPLVGRIACDLARNLALDDSYAAAENASVCAGGRADGYDVSLLPLPASLEKLLSAPVRSEGDASSRQSASGGGVGVLPRRYSRRSLVAPEWLCLWKARGG